eukprot:gene6593-3248_t
MQDHETFEPECGAFTKSSESEATNCGETDGVMRCSRCRAEWFCSSECQKAYWPFHRSDCKKNEFADAVEQSDPKFAKWMRKHGKLAVLKDDEVERIERASHAVSGSVSRQDVMESMYGRIEPKPLAPSYSTQEISALTWKSLNVPPNMGMECSRYKWRQNQSHVEAFVCIPPQLLGVPGKLPPTSYDCSDVEAEGLSAAEISGHPVPGRGDRGTLSSRETAALMQRQAGSLAA